MLTLPQRLDLMKLATDIAKTKAGWSNNKPAKLEEDILSIYERLRPSVESGSAFENTSISDVKTAVDVASTIDGFLE